MSLKVIGHRGSGRIEKNPFADGKPAQHTPKSYEQAVLDGADGVEFDIFITKDEVPVVIHRAAANEIGIGELTKAELDIYSTAKGEEIYTLEETLIAILDIQKQTAGQKLLINAELKGPGVIPSTVEVVNKLVKSHGLDKNQIFYDALEWERVAEMKKADPDAQIMPALSTARLFNVAAGATLDPEHKDREYDPQTMKELEEFIVENGAMGIDVMTADIRPEMIALARKLDIGFCSYPQGPHLLENADMTHEGMRLLEEFAKTSTKPVVMKTEDIQATRKLIDQIHKNKPSIHQTERMIGMLFKP